MVDSLGVHKIRNLRCYFFAWSIPSQTEIIQYRAGVWKCHRSLSPDPSPRDPWVRDCYPVLGWGLATFRRASTIPPPAPALDKNRSPIPRNTSDNDFQRHGRCWVAQSQSLLLEVGEHWLFESAQGCTEDDERSCILHWGGHVLSRMSSACGCQSEGLPCTTWDPRRPDYASTRAAKIIFFEKLLKTKKIQRAPKGPPNEDPPRSRPE